MCILLFHLAALPGLYLIAMILSLVQYLFCLILRSQSACVDKVLTTVTRVGGLGLRNSLTEYRTIPIEFLILIGTRHKLCCSIR